MPTILAIASQKGGVGKTTVALNLAHALARRGWRTVLVDADPQGGVGWSVSGSDRPGSGLLPWLRGESSFAEAVLATRDERLALLPFGGEGGDEDGPAAHSLLAEGALRFGLLQDAADLDLAVVDTPAGTWGITRDVLRGADTVLLTLQAEPLALRSLNQVVEAVEAVRREGRELAVAGILLTMVDSRQGASLGVAQETWGRLPSGLVLDAHVPRDAAFLDASAHGVPVAFLSRRPPPAAAVFDRIAAELEPRLGLATGDAGGPLGLLDG